MWMHFLLNRIGSGMEMPSVLEECTVHHTKIKLVEAGHESGARDGVRCFARGWHHPERTESRLGAED